MPARTIPALLIILVFCSFQTTAFGLQQDASISSETYRQAIPQANSDQSYCPWIYMNAGQKGPFEFGLLVNSTLMMISSQIAYTKFNY